MTPGYPGTFFFLASNVATDVKLIQQLPQGPFLNNWCLKSLAFFKILS